MIQTEAVELIAWHVNGSVHRFNLETNQGVFVGRSSNCGFRLNGHDISDIHCRIGFEEGHLWVQDWMSAKGTRLNGQVIGDRAQFGPGSVIEVGPYKIQTAKSSGPATVEPTVASDEQATSDQQTSKPLPRAAQILRDSLLSPEPMSSEPMSSEPVSPEPVSPEPVSPEPAQLAPPRLEREHSGAELLDSALSSPADDESASESALADSSGSLMTEAEELLDNHASPTENDSSIDSSDGQPSRAAPPQAQDCWSKGLTDFDFPGDDEDACFASDELFDRETVELLQAEIEDLRAALAQRDADQTNADVDLGDIASPSAESEKMLQRIQELVEEADRADERVQILEEMLHAAEAGNRAEAEERGHLEAWVGDIEKRVGQREQEHAAELEAMRTRFDQAEERYQQLQRQLERAATSGDNSQQEYEQTLQNWQQENRQLADSLSEAEKEIRQLKNRCDRQSEQTEIELREERAKIAKEQAEMSRLKFEYAQKIGELEAALAKSGETVDPRLQSLRAHRQQLREMNEERKREQEESSLSGRLKRLWALVE